MVLDQLWILALLWQARFSSRMCESFTGQLTGLWIQRSWLESLEQKKLKNVVDLAIVDKIGRTTEKNFADLDKMLPTLNMSFTKIIWRGLESMFQMLKMLNLRTWAIMWLLGWAFLWVMYSNMAEWKSQGVLMQTELEVPTTTPSLITGFIRWSLEMAPLALRQPMSLLS